MQQIGDLPEQSRLAVLRERFKSSIEYERDWRDAAREDLEFYAGIQWGTEEVDKLRRAKRPALTINKIRPMVNLLSGYQRLNRYEPDFLPRTADDLEKAKVAKGVTKYILDKAMFDSVESDAAVRTWLTGRGWYHVYWEHDWRSGQSDLAIKSISPFDIYLDPECTHDDLSDAEYIAHARWVSKEKVKRIYPEAADTVDGIISRYDQDEEALEHIGTEPLWYTTDLQKCRLVTMWYRHYERDTVYVLPDGTEIPSDQMDDLLREVAQPKPLYRQSIRCATFVGDLLLEDIESPYKHNRFPYVLVTAYWLGEGDIPAGLVRDLKDPQRELNKRRSQLTHILNTMANRGWLTRRGSLTPDQKQRLEMAGSTPGAVLEYEGDKPEPFATDSIPTTFFQTDAQNTNDIREISGINEAMLGMAPASQSGRAKELDQRQAVTSITLLFDKLRTAKLRMLRLLWGGEGNVGLIPQFFTEPKVFRIISDAGQPEFVGVNQPVQAGIDPLTGQAVTTLMNDLSTFEFDMIITDTPATPSQRVAAFYALLEMVKSGIPVPPDMVIEASDLPQKEELKARMQAAQQAQQAPPPQPGGEMPPGMPGAPPMAPQQGPNQADVLQMIAGMRG